MNVVRPNAGCHGCGSGSSVDSVSTENKNAETRSAGNLELMAHEPASVEAVCALVTQIEMAQSFAKRPTGVESK